MHSAGFRALINGGIRLQSMLQPLRKTMWYTVSPATEADIGEIAVIAAEAFASNGVPEYMTALQLELNTPDSLARTRKRYEEAMHRMKEPELFLKVTEKDHSTPLGVVMSARHDEPPTSFPIGLEEVPFASQDDREYAEHLRSERNKLVLRTFAEVDYPAIRT